MLWIAVTDSTTCRVYRYQKKSPKLTLILEITHPEIRLKNSEMFTSDKPGHYKTDHGTGGSYSQPTDPKEIEKDRFAREIAKKLNEARNKQAFTELIIIAPPHMNGLISQHADKNLKEMIKQNINKDILHFNENELVKFLEENV